jgi:hypothetical protein
MNALHFNDYHQVAFEIQMHVALIRTIQSWHEMTCTCLYCQKIGWSFQTLSFFVGCSDAIMFCFIRIIDKLTVSFPCLSAVFCGTAESHRHLHRMEWLRLSWAKLRWWSCRPVLYLCPYSTVLCYRAVRYSPQCWQLQCCRRCSVSQCCTVLYSSLSIHETTTFLFVCERSLWRMSSTVIGNMFRKALIPATGTNPSPFNDTVLSVRFHASSAFTSNNNRQWQSQHCSVNTASVLIP